MENFQKIAVLIDADNTQLTKLEAVLHEVSTYGRIGVKVWIYKGEILTQTLRTLAGEATALLAAIFNSLRQKHYWLPPSLLAAGRSVRGARGPRL